MIGIVIVSHSAKLAEGVLELVSQMTQGQVPLAAAGGIDDLDNPIGTDATRIYEAIESVYSEDGVLVLMDMGSALLSTEMALEFLSEEQQEKVKMCAGPLVEGAMAAAVQAMSTTDIEALVMEAQTALDAKAAQLGQPVTAQKPGSTPSLSGSEITLPIRNFHGLHARPAAQFVSTAGRFEATVLVRNVTTGVGPVNAKSINQVATIGARQGHEIGVTAEGPDADEALAALSTLVAHNFGESEEPPEMIAAPEKATELTSYGELPGIAVSPGIAIGPAALYQTAAITVESRHIDNPEHERARLEVAIEQAKADIKQLFKKARDSVGQYEAAIFEAHQLFLDDPLLVDSARNLIEAKSINAEWAWQQAVDRVIADYQQLDDPYLQARAADVFDVGQQVLKFLVDAPRKTINMPQPAILVASDLTPSDTAQLDPAKVLGICTARGSATSHSAILARALGIPAVVGLGDSLNGVSASTILALDGERGRVWLDPTGQVLVELTQQREQWLADQKAAHLASQKAARTRDGRRVEVVANIGGLHDARVALDAGAEGVGLFRTEFLFLDRTTPPSEDEQFEIYKSIGDVLGTHPLVIRTLDIGGDKPLPYMQVDPEENPFLGWRGIRMMLNQTDMFTAQLRAILKASPGHQFKVMFPMVSTVDEVKAARRLFSEVEAELAEAGIPFDRQIEVGIMIEVPAAVAIADQLAADVDFFSIGTNDLSQYTMAADRTNPKVATLANAFQPAVLRMIRQVIEAAHQAGIWVGLCGEFAGNTLATPILLGLGLDEFSMSAPSIPQVKQTLASLTVEDAQRIAHRALQLPSAAAVRDFVASLR